MQASDYKTLSWHSTQWQRLLGRGLDRLGHASLLLGAPGLGQRDFANALAALLLCESPRQAPSGSQLPPMACGNCPSCHWLSTESHPDFRCVQPEAMDEEDAGEGAAPAKATSGKAAKKASDMIKIGAIRALEDFVFVGSHRHGRRVIIIDPAEAMNVHAANSLLKILEEPPPSVYFILVSTKPQALLPTLRSRCRSLSFQRPARAQAEEWLRTQGADTRATRFLDVVGGAPATILAWQEEKVLPAVESVIESLFAVLKAPATVDPLALAAQWDGLLKKETALNLDLLVEAIQRWLLDLAQRQANGLTRYHTAWSFPEASRALPLTGVVAAWRELLSFRRSSRHPLNQLLFLEDLATRTLRAVQPARNATSGR